MSIEAPAPLDLTDEHAELVLDFMSEAERRVRSSTAISIAVAVARETVLRGDCRIAHKDFGRRTGACRRSVDKAIRALKGARLIERTGTTSAGIAIYRAAVVAERSAHDVA